MDDGGHMNWTVTRLSTLNHRRNQIKITRENTNSRSGERVADFVSFQIQYNIVVVVFFFNFIFKIHQMAKREIFRAVDHCIKYCLNNVVQLQNDTNGLSNSEYSEHRTESESLCCSNTYLLCYICII